MSMFTLLVLKLTVTSEASLVPEWSGVGVAGEDLAPPSVSVPEELVSKLLADSRPDRLAEEGLDRSLLWSVLLATVRDIIPGVGPWGRNHMDYCITQNMTVNN